MMTFWEHLAVIGAVLAMVGAGCVVIAGSVAVTTYIASLGWPLSAQIAAWGGTMIAAGAVAFIIGAAKSP